MKSKDSSPQAPQNNKEKRNGGGQPSETAIVSRETSFRSPVHCPFSNARLNHRRKAAGFILRMFQLPEHRPREVVTPLRLIQPESEQAREDRPIPRLNDRASPESQRSAPIQKNKNPAPHVPPMRPPTLYTPNYSLLIFLFPLAFPRGDGFSNPDTRKRVQRRMRA